MKYLLLVILIITALSFGSCTKSDVNTFQYACFCTYGQVSRPDTFIAFHLSGSSRENEATTCNNYTSYGESLPYYNGVSSCKLQ